MKRISTRRGILGGGLLLAVAVWGFDHLSGGHPAMVQASQTTGPVDGRDAAASRAAGPAPASWEPIEDFVGRLTASDYVSSADDLAQLERDVFLPTPAIEELVPPVAAVPAAALAAADTGTTAVTDTSFATRHKLTGVVVGGVSVGGAPTLPLAVVDDQVLTLNSDLDGYTLLEVQRDYVVFRQAASGERVTLELKQGPKTPP